MTDRWLATLSGAVERFVPDAIVTSGLLLIAIAGVAAGVGASPLVIAEAYYKGLWMLLSFTMQMTLVLLLSLMIAVAPSVRSFILRCADLPRTPRQAVIGVGLLGATVGYLNWGLGLTLGPLIAVHFARSAERRGVNVDFPFLMALVSGTGSIWQFGLSASAPLLSATEGHFLAAETGTMTLATTIFAPASVVFVLVFTAAAIAIGCLIMPRDGRPLSSFAESSKCALETSLPAPPPTPSFAERMDRAVWAVTPVWLALAVWLWIHFFVRGASLDINSMITILLLTSFLLHRTVERFTAALREAIGSVWPVLLLYHLYAGVAGLIQYTPAGEFLANLSAPLANRWTYVLLTAAVSTVVALFVPTSGGQWLIQGFVTVRMATAVGVTAQRGMLALSIGDHMGNLISPFWAVVGAGVARLDFRLFFGYRLIFAALWFTLGVIIFTWLPC